MRLDQLTLTTFRGFESLHITFDPHVTVLLGGNMSGKTAVLEAAAVALGAYFSGFDQEGSAYASQIEPSPARTFGKSCTRSAAWPLS